MNYNRDAMSFTHYRWEPNVASEDGLFSGEPTRRSFDPFNGSQVLFLINYFGSLCEEFTVKHARIIEKKIAYSLPLEKKSEISVIKWLRDSVVTEQVVKIKE